MPIGSVYRYRTDLEPIPNLNSVFKKTKKNKKNILFIFFTDDADFSFGIGSKSLDTDFLPILRSIAMLYSQLQATNCIRFYINASLIPIPIPISCRIHTDFIPISIPIPIPRYFGRKIPIPIPNSKSHTVSSLIIVQNLYK